MIQRDDAWTDAQRRRFMRPDAHRYVRHDAWRFMTPGAPRLLSKDVVGYFWPEATRLQSQQPDSQADVAALRAERDELLRMRRELVAIKVELKFRKLLRALKAYNPDQPRVPAGNPDGGQWTDSNGQGSGSSRPDRIRLAGEIPTGEPPEVPKERPATVQERNRVARGLSRGGRLRGFFGVAGEAVKWLEEYWPEIVADQDRPKTLEMLQDAAFAPRKGYHLHHVVEQGPARDEGFSEDLIEGRENRVLIPKYQHERLTAWFNTKGDRFGGMSPRDYLRGKDWNERTSIGLDALEEFGVLKR
jgi:hypothetical protein